MEIYQKICRSAKVLFIGLSAVSCYPATSKPTDFDDWIINYGCSRDANTLCSGYYQQPPYANIDPQEEAKLPLTVKSGEASYVPKGTSVFKGKVVASQGTKFIYADQANVAHNPKTGELETLTALGHVKIMQPGLRVDGTKAVADIAKDQKNISDASYRLYDRHARGTADSLVIDGKTKMSLCEASYTTCAPNNNDWYLKANKLEFDKESGRGQAWNAKLYVKDMPVFYWPYVNFPIDKRRQTGFLKPSLESSTRNGKTVVAPFYWNLAPNYDATISTSYMSKRGFKVDNLFRYLTHSSEGTINFDFLPKDREYRALRNAQLNNPSFMQSTDNATILQRNDLKDRNLRYKIAVKNSSKITRDLIFMLDYTNASDGNYLYDFSADQSETLDLADNQFYNIYALQRATLQYNNYLGSLKYQLEEYKTFHYVNGPNAPQQLSKLPAVSFNSANFDLPLGINWLTNANYTKFRPRLISDDNKSLSYGQRFQIRPAISYDYVQPGWFLKPRVQLNHVQYSALHISSSDIANGVKTNSSHLSIPMYDLKSGLIFERNMEFRNIGLVQTLEPQLYYLYVPDRNQNYLPNFDSAGMNFDYNQVFRDNRYSGLDRVAEANQLGMGLASKFYRSDTGEDQGMIGIGRIRYFRDPVIRLKETSNINQHWSAIAMIARLNLASQYTLEANWVRYKQQTNTASLQLQYRPNDKQVINFGYEFIRDPSPDLLNSNVSSDIKQIKLSTAWRATPALRILGLINYDLLFSRDLDALAGFEYHTCCTAVRVVWGRTWDANTLNVREHNSKIRLQFIFKGFDGVGNAEDSYLGNKIPGYVG